MGLFSKCKYRKICKEYQKESPMCNEDGGAWSYGKMANCWMKFYKESKKIGFFKKFNNFNIWTKQLTIFFSLVFLLSVIYAIPQITEITTPTGTTSNSSVIIEYNITMENGEDIENITWSWDGTNYLMYDPSLVLFMNFNNFSALGENDTHVKDLSIYNFTTLQVYKSYPNSSGKNNGAFSFNRSDFGFIKLTNYSNGFIGNNSGWTISLWFYAINGTTGDPFSKGYTQRFNIYYSQQDGIKMSLIARNSSGADKTLLINNGNVINKDLWHNVIFTWNKSNIYAYWNGILQSSNVLDNMYADVTDLNSFYYLGRNLRASTYFNGLIDDLMVWNRSLSTSEIQQLYYSSLTKYDSQNWTFQTNQTLNYSTSRLNASSPTYDNDYNLCSSNSSGNENCTSIKTITQTIPIKVLTANFTNGRNINNYFYGMDFNINSLVETSWIDTDDDGVIETSSNETQHRNNFSAMNIDLFRINLELGTMSPSEGVFNTTATSNYGNIVPKKEMIKYAYDNNLFVYIVTLKIPEWLQNRTSGWCNSTKWDSCSPTNYSRYGQLIVEALDNITNNGEYSSAIKYLEIGNEPYLSTWLNNLTNDNQTKADEMVKLLNISIPLIHASYPNIKISGGTAYTMSTSGNMMTTVLSNLSDILGFYPVHYYPYYTSSTNFSSLGNMINNISSLCSGDSCYIINSEVIAGSASGDTFSSTDQTQNKLQQSLYFYSWLSLMPENSSNIYFSWSAQNKFSDTNFQWDKKYPMFSESLLDNEISGAYNVWKNFAHLCPAGSTVYSSNSDDSTIKTVTCKKNAQYSVIVINTDTSSKNVTLDGTSTPSSSKAYLMDISSGNLYLTNNSNSLGIMDSYDIKYLVTPNFTLSDNNNLIKKAPTGESYNSTNEINISSKTTTSSQVNYIINNALKLNLTITLNISDPCPNSISSNINSSLSFSCNSPVQITTPLIPGSNTITLSYPQPGGSGGGPTSSYNQEINVCLLVYDFIIGHYKNNSLDYSLGEFENLKYNTNLSSSEVIDYLSNYPNKCDQELPFTDYNPFPDKPVPKPEICKLVHEFILTYYTPEKNFQYTEGDLELLGLRTLLNKKQSENYLINFEDLCEEELPFVNYNPKLLTFDNKIVKSYKSFLETLKGDLKYIIISILIMVGLAWLINKYG